MSLHGLRLHLTAASQLVVHKPSHSFSYRSLHSLRCYARPKRNNFTLQQSVLIQLARKSGTLSNVSVAPPTNWVDRLPKSVRPYLYLTRIDKPIGTLLLFYPCGK